MALCARVMSEFFWVATRRLDPPLTAAEAERSMTNYTRSWRVYPITTRAVMEAVRAVQPYQFAFWDALVWATAKLNNVLSILTEDRPSSPPIEGVRFVDPFVATFDIAQLR